MNRMTAAAVFLAALMAADAARAQTRATGADVCITIDEARDTLSPQDRTAALILVARQFELAGDRVAPERCLMPYTVAHVKLGETIMVTLSGPNGSRDGTALGLDDLPALYSQMVRSIVTGRPMTGFNVVDRTNVTEAQVASTKRVQSDSFGYARLGYGSVFGDRSYGGPTMGFGYRAELDSFGLDVSFLNLQMPASGSSSYSASQGGTSGSVLKLEGLYFMNPKANATAYLGGGVSYGFTDFGGTYTSSSSGYQSSWRGNGLQGELSVGYEWPRASTLRMFLQADTILPFYNVSSDTVTYSRSGPTKITTDHRYSPAVVVSVGFGWQRNRRGR